jgi:tellurite resistance-related uncharacterized protein
MLKKPIKRIIKKKVAPLSKLKQTPIFAMIDGRIVERKGGIVTVEIFSGLQLNISEEGISEIREYEDPITGQAMVQLTVNENTPVNAKIIPRLIKEAHKAKAIPFGFQSLLKGKQKWEAIEVLPDQAASKATLAAAQTRSIFQTDTWCVILTAHLLDDSHGDINSIDD